MDNWLPLKRLGGLMEKRLAWLSKNRAKNLIKTGSLKRFLEFSISHQKKRKNPTFHMALQYSCFYSHWNREGQSHAQMQNNEIITEHAESHRNNLNFRKSFRKGAVAEFYCYLSFCVCYISCSTVPLSCEPLEPVEAGGALFVFVFPWQCG